MRQSAGQKTMFLLPPREGEETPVMSQVARERLRLIGFTLPERVEPGFFMMGADGSCERHIPFDLEWEAEIRTRARLHARLY